MKLRSISRIIQTELLLPAEQQKNQSDLREKYESANFFLTIKNKRGERNLKATAVKFEYHKNSSLQSVKDVNPIIHYVQL